ncbi:MAG: hypothetical protein HRT47_13330 [Candidatus Caenarcaniphilales bacterium]|nr:hypothetical protein [Candidatus Caenarcaniphilales bacterium]
MNINIDTLSSFDANNDGRLSQRERDMYDAHAEQENLTSLKDSINGIQNSLDLRVVDQFDLDGDGILGNSENTLLNSFNESGVMSGSYFGGNEFVKTGFSEDSNSFSEANAWGVMNVENGLVTGGTDINGVGYIVTNNEDNNNYTQISDNGAINNVENGLVVSGKHADGSEFTRTNISADNLNYTETQDWGSMNVENGLVTGGTHNNGANFTRTYSEDYSTFTDTYEDGSQFTYPHENNYKSQEEIMANGISQLVSDFIAKESESPTVNSPVNNSSNVTNNNGTNITSDKDPDLLASQILILSVVEGGQAEETRAELLSELVTLAGGDGTRRSPSLAPTGISNDTDAGAIANQIEALAGNETELGNATREDLLNELIEMAVENGAVNSSDSQMLDSHEGLSSLNEINKKIAENLAGGISDDDLNLERMELMNEISGEDELDTNGIVDASIGKIRSAYFVELFEASLAELEGQLSEHVSSGEEQDSGFIINMTTQISLSQNLINFHSENEAYYDKLLNS